MEQAIKAKGQHPPALFILFFTEMWERFSYYGMRALLVMFLVSAHGYGGWNWTRKEALSLYGMYTGLFYFTPIIGGILADKFLGYRNAVMLGAFLMTCGHGAMALGEPWAFYTGLTLLIAGNGFFKPNISSIVGSLYKDNPGERDTAYYIFYMGISAGSFLGILLCGYIGMNIGWHYGFGLAGIFMLFALLQFAFARKIFGDIGLKPLKKAAGTGAIATNEKPILTEEGLRKKKITNDRLMVIGVFAFFSIFFWMSFEQAGGSMTIFASDYTNRVITGNAAIAYIWINAFITIVPMIVLSWVLVRLFRKTFKQYALSNCFLGLSFVIIWVLVLWMVLRDFNMKGYRLDIGQPGKTEFAVIRDNTPLVVGGQVYILDLDKKGRYKLLDAAHADQISDKIPARVTEVKDNELEITTSWFGMLNALFLILFAPLFSKLWELRPGISAPVKFAAGLMLLGVGFAALAYGSRSIPQGAASASVSMVWLIVAYLVHTWGELALSPVGLSYVSKLSPPRLVGFMFGIWFFCSFIAGFLAGMTGSFIDDITRRTSMSTFFFLFTFITMGAGVIMLLLNKLLVRRMHEVE